MEMSELAGRIQAERLAQFGSKSAAYRQAGVSPATWDRAEEGLSVRQDRLAAIVRTLWPHTSGDWTRIDDEPVPHAGPRDALLEYRETLDSMATQLELTADETLRSMLTRELEQADRQNDLMAFLILHALTRGHDEPDRSLRRLVRLYNLSLPGTTLEERDGDDAAPTTAAPLTAAPDPVPEDEDEDMPPPSRLDTMTTEDLDTMAATERSRRQAPSNQDERESDG